MSASKDRWMDQQSQAFDEILSRYAALPDQIPPGQGPGEDGEEGTGPTPEQIREMHEEEREDRYLRARERLRYEIGLRAHVTEAQADIIAQRCLEALRKEGLL